MSQPESVIVAYAILLIAITTGITVLYHKRIRLVSNEYWEAKTIIESIVTTFKKRYDNLTQKNTEQSIRLDQLLCRVDALSETTQNLPAAINKLEAKVETLSRLGEDMSKDIKSLKSELQIIKQKGEEQTQVSTLTKIDSIEPQKKQESRIHPQLTPTEEYIIRLLRTEGPKTSRQIEAKINKTREHTARLMKKLWELGYVERETHKTPFTYRLANGFTKVETHQA